MLYIISNKRHAKAENLEFLFLQGGQDGQEESWTD